MGWYFAGFFLPFVLYGIRASRASRVSEPRRGLRVELCTNKSANISCGTAGARSGTCRHDHDDVARDGRLVGFFAWVGASYRSAYATKRQAVIEGVVNYIADLATSTLGEKGEPYVPFFIALFVFIFLLNQFGMLPFKALGLPFGGSPTADLNTAVPLALIVFFMTWIVGIREERAQAVRARVQADCLAFPDQHPRRARASRRRWRPVLFFNIFVGELLFIIVASIIVAHVKIGRSISRSPSRSFRSSSSFSTSSSERSKRSYSPCWRSSISRWRSPDDH